MSERSLHSVWKRLLPKPIKNKLMVAWYNLIARLDRNGDVMFMNHGYYECPSGESSLRLPPELEPYRYPIQLYDLLAREVTWQDKDVLEVSSGLGGGALWIWQTYGPRSFVGLDIAAQETRKCAQRFGRRGINFQTGDAQALPFPDHSFDILINVESSLNYPDIAKFLHEAQRVLKPGGHFLFADYRRSSKISRLEKKLIDTGMEVLSLKNVTPGIIRGIEREETRKRNLIKRRVPRILMRSVLNFAGLGQGEASELHQFSSGEKSYIAAVLKKGRPAVLEALDRGKMLDERGLDRGHFGAVEQVS